MNKFTLIALPLLLACQPEKPDNGTKQKLPNLIVLLADDMGYGDLSLTGHPLIRTPNIDRMAREGVQATQFYTTNAVCAPTRSALLTGRYPIHTGMVRNPNPTNELHLSLDETTLAQRLKEKNYATCMLGKWHLGHSDTRYFPTRRGFDTFLGVLYSNDMAPFRLYRDTTVLEHPVNQHTLTRRYTREAQRFIEEQRDRPFFIYLAHSMPHTPLAVSEAFKGISDAGRYGDAVEEIDWSTGQILHTLDSLNLQENTWVIFTSDNGPLHTHLVEKVYGKKLAFDGTVDASRPWNIGKTHGGSAGPFRGGKATTWEGGHRVPFIARWPGKLPAGTRVKEVVTVMDIYPTMLQLAGLAQQEKLLDGKPMLEVLNGSSPTAYSAFYYYHGDQLQAVRSGAFKLHFRVADEAWNWSESESPLLFHLEEDPGEKYNLASQYPEQVQHLTRMAEDFSASALEKNARK